MSDMLVPLFVLRYNCLRLITKPRFYIILIISAVYLSDITAPICEYSRLKGEPVSLWLFPLLLNNSGIVLVLFLLGVLLFCDAPFLENAEPYIFIRSGRRQWICAQFLFVLLLSAIYIAHIILWSIIPVFFCAAHMPEWGKILYSLANTNAWQLVDLPTRISSFILNQYSPKCAFGVTATISFLVIVLIGSIMFCANLTIHRSVGNILGSLLVLEQYFATNSSGHSLYFFSPVSWVNLEVIHIDGIAKTPSVSYALAILIALSVCCWIISFLVIRKKSIQPFKAL